MTPLLSPETFEFFARFLLAGFVIISVRSWFVVAARPKPSEVLFDAVIFSLVNQLIFQIFTPITFTLAELADARFQAFFRDILESQFPFFVEVLFLPALLGFLLGKGLSGDQYTSLLRRFAYPNAHPAERAYDFAFSRMDGPSFVIVTYQDGTTVNGYFGQQSLAATDANRSDLVLERVYDVKEDGTWEDTSPPRSALIYLNQIRSIEFIPVEEEA